jgi:maltose alpha-D-glucosyltransferase/alpha-amylase
VEHAWFKQSCQPGRNEYTDWYVWTNSVWTWSAPGVQTVIGYSQRNGNYITNFFHFQPALNYGFAQPDPDHPWQQPVDAPGPQAVRQELKNIMKFWLDRGADGFRVDMAGSLIKRDTDGTATAALWQEIRAWLDRDYPEAAMISEWSRPTVAIPAGFHMDFMLPFARNGYQALFRLRDGSDQNVSYFHPGGRGNIRFFLEDYLANFTATREQGFIAIPSGNHDTWPRLANERTSADLELAFLFLLTLPGVPFLYYGDEIGMHSPAGLISKEGGYERTGARTPMQWDGGTNAGFSTAPADQLYLPVDTSPQAATVAAQRGVDGSTLEHVRRLIALRHAHPALGAEAGFEPVYAEENAYPFVYKRTAEGETVLVALNPADRPCEITLPAGLLQAEPETLYGREGAFSQQSQTWHLTLPAVSGGLYLIS